MGSNIPDDVLDGVYAGVLKDAKSHFSKAQYEVPRLADPWSVSIQNPSLTFGGYTFSVPSNIAIQVPGTNPDNGYWDIQNSNTVARWVGSQFVDRLSALGYEMSSLPDPKVLSLTRDLPGWNNPADNLRGIDHCFPSGTLITMADGSQKAIEQLTIADQVLTFDGDGNPCSGDVVRTYTNTTSEFIRLRFNDGRDDLVATPGHAFLTETGDYLEIGTMARLSGGVVRLVDHSGNVITASAEHLYYSSATASLFTTAQHRSMSAVGNLAFKEETVNGWATYNFEVQTTHNYVAGDIRVHNKSGPIGQFGDSLDSGLDRLSGVKDGDGSFLDKSSDLINSGMHVVDRAMKNISAGFSNMGNSLVAGVTGVAASIMGGISGFAGNLARGNIVGAIGSVVAGAVGAVTSALGAVTSAIGSVVSGIANAIGSVFSSSEDNDSGGNSSGKPVVIDMDGDGIELTKLSESTTDFDFDDGYLERTAWTTGDDALLVFDLDNDNKVTQSKEIAFAKWTEEDDTDLEALATHFDTNKDKVLDSRDAGWSSFKIWQDRDTDGVVDDGEMLTLEEAGIKSIGLRS